MMDEYKKAAEILEMMTEEPEPGHEARLDADELDAVLLACEFCHHKDECSASGQEDDE